MTGYERRGPFRRSFLLLPLLLAYPLAGAFLLIFIGVTDTRTFGSLLVNILVSEGLLAAIALIARPQAETRPGRPAPALPLKKGCALAAALAVLLQLGAAGLDTLLPELPGGLELPSGLTAGQYGALLLLLTVLPAFVEEWVFRARLIPHLGEGMPMWAAELLSALLFAAIHDSARSFLAVFAVGLLHACLMRQTGSLVPCIVSHLTFNLASFVLEMAGVIPAPWMALALVPVLAFVWAGQPGPDEKPEKWRLERLIWAAAIIAIHLLAIAASAAGYSPAAAGVAA